MGLFGNKEPRELRELLEAMRLSTLTDIDAIRAGSPLPLTKSEAGSQVLAGMTLNRRITRCAELAQRMDVKGRRDEAEAILEEFRDRPAPVFALGSGPEALGELDRLDALRSVAETELPPITGSGTAAQAEEARREELRRIWADDARWRQVIDEIRARARPS